MKKNQYGFAFLEILLILAVVGVISFIGYRVYSSQRNKPSESTQTNTEAVTQLPKEQVAEKVEEVPVDPTADWETYKSKTGKYALKYPNDWHAKVCDPEKTDLTLFLGPTNSSRVVCDSEHFSQIMIVSSPNLPTESEQQLGRFFGKKKTEKVTVDGIEGFCETGKLILQEEGYESIPLGTKVKRCFFLRPDRGYSAMYIQTPSGDYNSDILEEFDLIVEKTLDFAK